jgi:hypothetical protein
MTTLLDKPEIKVSPRKAALLEAAHETAAAHAELKQEQPIKCDRQPWIDLLAHWLIGGEKERP